LDKHVESNYSDPDQKRCIVIIDDEIDLLTVYKKALEMSGLAVSSFSDPIMALDEFKINHSKYSLVMTDIRMPSMNGYELINQIKKIDPFVKVIFITAQEVSKSEIMSKLDEGISIDEYISKPVSLEKLNQAVFSVIKNNR
jgi:DNA-binding NtrC family response regulator